MFPVQFFWWLILPVSKRNALTWKCVQLPGIWKQTEINIQCVLTSNDRDTESSQTDDEELEEAEGEEDVEAALREGPPLMSRLDRLERRIGTLQHHPVKTKMLRVQAQVKKAQSESTEKKEKACRSGKRHGCGWFSCVWTWVTVVWFFQKTRWPRSNISSRPTVPSESLPGPVQSGWGNKISCEGKDVGITGWSIAPHPESWATPTFWFNGFLSTTSSSCAAKFHATTVHAASNHICACAVHPTHPAAHCASAAHPTHPATHCASAAHPHPASPEIQLCWQDMGQRNSLQSALKDVFLSRFIRGHHCPVHGASTGFHSAQGWGFTSLVRCVHSAVRRRGQSVCLNCHVMSLLVSPGFVSSTVCGSMPQKCMFLFMW